MPGLIAGGEPMISGLARHPLGHSYAIYIAPGLGLYPVGCAMDQ
jgi:hypothetical protein